MHLRVVLVILALFSLTLQASEPVISPVRHPDRDWMEALESSFQAAGVEAFADSALAFAGDPAIAGIPEWRHGIDSLARLFFAAKDTRIHKNPNVSDFRRKGAWLYPTDGCYSKAAHVSYVAGEKGYVKPGKIYAFGNLRYHSRYSLNGKTSYWSYHVAAAYRIGSTVYILDPSVTEGGLLTREQWIGLITANPASVRVSLCDSRSYSPYSKCRGGRGNGAYLGHMNQFLRLEWNGLIRLGFSPRALLAP